MEFQPTITAPILQHAIDYIPSTIKAFLIKSKPWYLAPAEPSFNILKLNGLNTTRDGKYISEFYNQNAQSLTLNQSNLSKESKALQHKNY